MERQISLLRSRIWGLRRGQEKDRRAARRAARRREVMDFVEVPAMAVREAAPEGGDSEGDEEGSEEEDEEEEEEEDEGFDSSDIEYDDPPRFVQEEMERAVLVAALAEYDEADVSV